jgi:hypothetical protein
MKKSELKDIIKEELQAYRERVQENMDAKPVVDHKKAAGIILGAVKTLFNSGAITGVDATYAKEITKELIKHINVAIAPYGQKEEPMGDDLNDDAAYDEEEESLDDQSQYDPDLSKQTSDYEPEPGEPEEDEPLFEVKKIAEKLKL